MSNYKYTFFDNQLIGVDHLNEITERLVSGGISAVYSGVDFNVSDINDTNKAILTGGVVPENDLNLKVTTIDSGRYLINPGLCFFNNGTTMEVLSGGEEISVLLGTKRYVYLVSDANKMSCYVEVLENEKQSGEFILLAIINTDGTITDKRTYARGKVPGFYASSDGLEINITETYTGPIGFVGTNIEIAVGEGAFKHLCIRAESGAFHNGAGYNITYGGLFYCDFENGVAVNPTMCAVQGGDGYIFYERNIGSCCLGSDIRLENGKLIIPVLQGNVNKGYEVTFSYHLW